MVFKDSAENKTRVDPFILIRLLHTVYFALVVIISFIMIFCTQTLCWILLWPSLIYNEKFKLLLMGSILRFFSVLGAFYANPFWRLKIVKPPPAGYSPSDTLLMSNHLTCADPWVVACATLPWELKYVYKAEVSKVPIAGWCVSMAHDIPIHFTKEKGGWGTMAGSVARVMSICADLQRKGIGQVVFPEGTRSKSGRLQPLRTGFFRFAIEQQCEILPFVHHNTNSLWKLGSMTIGCGTCYVAFGTPIRVDNTKWTVESLRDHVHNEMVKLFHYCPLYDALQETPVTEAATVRGHGLVGASDDSCPS